LDVIKYLHMTLDPRKHFCHDIHSSLHMRWTENGWRARPCCFSSAVSTDVDTSRTNWFDNLWPQLRSDNISDKPLDPAICAACIGDETVGKQSKRLGEIIKRGNKPNVGRSGPRYLEITMEYTCNQACMICRPDASTLWRKYARAGEFDVDMPRNSPVASDTDIEQFLDSVDISGLDTIQIMGGEPLLTDRHIRLLQTMERKGVDLSRIELWYHTNGSCRVDEETLRLWGKFRQVILYFSLDDTGEAFNYQRFPGDWTTVTGNMEWFRQQVSHNVLLRVERTVGLLNAHRLWEVERWKVENFNETRSGYQIELNTHMAFGTVLSMHNISARHLKFLREDADRMKSLGRYYPIDALEARAGSGNAVRTFVEAQDQRRNMSIDSYFPEFRSLYG
jgi:hypothetical protein